MSTIEVPIAVYRAYLALEEEAQRYHEECGHDAQGAAAQCDDICEAWKVLCEAKRGLHERERITIEPAPGDRCGNTRRLHDGSPCPGCRACS